MYEPKTEAERKTLLAVLAVAGLILVALLIFYFMNPRDVVGDSLVNTPSGTPEELPPDDISPVYMKPVTIMYVSVVIFAFCFFALAKKWISRTPRSVRAFLMLASLLGLAVSVYETLFNFALWGSLLVSHPDPDTIFNAYPVGSVRVNLVFATKSFVALLFVTYFAFVTFRSSLEGGTA